MRIPRALIRRPGQTLRYVTDVACDPLLFSLYALRHRDDAALVRAVYHEHLTFLRRRNLADIATAVRRIEAAGVPGALIECGTALGGSAIVLAKTKSADRELRLYDAFGMIPPPSERDGQDAYDRFDKIASGKSAGIGGDTYYGYREDLLADVTSTLGRFEVDLEQDRVSLIKGFFDETLRISQPVALAHIDADWHDSVMTCLERIAPHLAQGGRLIIDDYFGYSGCRTAVDSYFARPDIKGRYKFERHSRIHIVKL